MVRNTNEKIPPITPIGRFFIFLDPERTPEEGKWEEKKKGKLLLKT